MAVEVTAGDSLGIMVGLGVGVEVAGIGGVSDGVLVGNGDACSVEVAAGDAVGVMVGVAVKVGIHEGSGTTLDVQWIAPPQAIGSLLSIPTIIQSGCASE